MKKITCIMMFISLVFLGGTTSIFASETKGNYCIVDDEGKSVCYDDEGKPIITYEHNNCPN